MDKLKTCPFCGAAMNFNPSSGEIIGWHKDDCFLLWLELDESRDMTNEEIVTEFFNAWNRRASDA